MELLLEALAEARELLCEELDWELLAEELELEAELLAIELLL